MKRIVLSVLILVLLSAVSTYSQNKPKKMQRVESGLKALNLTDEQKDKIEEFRVEHQKEMIDLRAELDRKELALKEFKMQDNFSRSGYINAVKEISEIKNRIAEVQANHRMDVYEMLDADQKKVWLKMDHKKGIKEDRMRLHRQHQRLD